MRLVHGINLDEEVEPLFSGPVSDRVLLLDADGIAYSVASTVKKLDTAYRNFIKAVMVEMFCVGAERALVYITPKGNRKAHREHYPTFKPYQGNRKNKSKPPLLEPLRTYLSGNPEGVPDNIEIIAPMDVEADDLVITAAHQYEELGVTHSPDKDLHMTPWPKWNADLGVVEMLSDGTGFGYVVEKFTEGGSAKAYGHGRKFFWYQMLAGDTADNVRGIDKLNGKNCGHVAALEYVNRFDDETELAEAILWEYFKINQDALAEAECLWLRRYDDDNAARYFLEVVQDSTLRMYIKALHKRHQRILDEKINESADLALQAESACEAGWVVPDLPPTN